MPSHRSDAAIEPRSEQGVLYRLLDPILGFGVWAVHFVVIYVIEAVACVLGLGNESPGSRAGLTTALAVTTVGAVVIVALHAIVRYRQNREAQDEGFLLGLTIGNDAIAAFAIGWQLLPILLVPVCR